MRWIKAERPEHSRALGRLGPKTTYVDECAPSLAGTRDVFVGIAVEGEHEEPSMAVGYGLTLATAAGAHLNVHSVPWRFTGEEA